MARSENDLHVEIIKDDISGLEKGQKKWLTPHDARALVESGLAKFVEEKKSKKED